MEEIIRFFEHLFGRASGPMNARLVIQPLVVLIFAARAGFRDARTGHSPYFMTMYGDPTTRRVLLPEGWKDVRKVFFVAIILDFVYQIVTVRWIYPVESLVVAVLLAFIPYVAFRGLFMRLGRRLGMGRKQPQT